MAPRSAPRLSPLDARMIARVWHGIVPVEKADGYAEYLANSNLGVRAYQAIPGNRGASLLRRVEGKRVHFLLISFWETAEAIRDYTGPDIERAQYFSYDLECLVDPEPNVAHYEVLSTAENGAAHATQARPAAAPIERALKLALPSGLW
jgi:heme-degrading monooxygenase HmoA